MLAVSITDGIAFGFIAAAVLALATVHTAFSGSLAPCDNPAPVDNVGMAGGRQLLFLMEDLWDEWPRLLGASFESFQSRIKPLLIQLNLRPSDPELLRAVNAVLDDYPQVSRRIREALDDITLVPLPRSAPPVPPVPAARTDGQAVSSRSSFQTGYAQRRTATRRYWHRRSCTAILAPAY